MIPLALLLPGSAIFGALGRRWSGGLLSAWLSFDIGTQPARLIWGATAGLTAWAAGAVRWHAAVLAVCIASGGILFGFWGSLGMGRRVTPVGYRWAGWPMFARDFALMEVHGLGGMALAALGAWWGGYAWGWLPAAGALCAPCYALAWAAPLDAPWLGCFGERDRPPTAELLWGACVGLACALVVVGR